MIPSIEKGLYNTLKEIAKNYNLQLWEGKKAYELKPNFDYNKGNIIKKLVKEFNLNTILYAGDDLVDIPAMQATKNNNGIAIGVCHEDSPKKIKELPDIYISEVDEIKTIFNYFLE